MKKNVVLGCLFLIVALLIPEHANAQYGNTSKIKVSGIITDTQGEALIGATVTLRSSNNKVTGALSDMDGHYSIIVNSESDKLEFSYIGFQSQIYTVGKNKSLNVTLHKNEQNLDEVVVTGYQTISRERATGAFAKVSADKLEQKRLSSLASVLEGQIAGFNDGKLRGVTSMNGMTTPLYVIDGFPVESTKYNQYGNLEESIPDLNIEDIESITVLKDAAATSIYGARAANGVVVIITKKASKGKTNISFSSTYTFSPYSYYMDNRTDAADIIGLEKGWADNNPKLKVAANSAGYITDAAAIAYATSYKKNAIFTSTGMQSILDYYSGKTTQTELNTSLSTLASKGYQYYKDVEKYAKRDPFYQQYNLRVGKSTDRNSFQSSVTYKKNQLEDKYSQNESIGLNLANIADINNWLRLELGSYTLYNNGKTQSYDALNPGFDYMPYNSLIGNDGNPYVSTMASRFSESTMNTINSKGLYNMDLTPLDELGRNLTKSKNFSNRTYAKLNIKFADWLKYSVQFQYEYSTLRSNKLRNKESYDVRSFINGFATYNSSTSSVIYNIPYGNINFSENQFSNAYNIRQQLDFNKTFADKHDLTVIAGTEARRSKLEYSNSTLYNYDPDMLSFELVDAKMLSNLTGKLISGSYFYPSNIGYQKELTNSFLSLYGNAGYTYEGKYTATGSLRWDRSNLWGTDSKYQNKPIWSVGASWNLNKESFFNVSWINMLKLRLSYGIGGNIAKNNAPYMTASYSQNTTVGGTQGYINSRPNPQLSWEKTTTTNIGTDFSILHGRLNGSIEYYNKKGEDLLASTMGIPTEGWGYSTYKINNGGMKNSGVEVTLNGDIIRTKDFTWNASLLYGYNKNKVTYVNVKAPVYYLQLDYPDAYPIIGNSYSAIYGYKWAGLSATGLPQVYDGSGNKVTNKPTTLDAITYCGSTVPVHTGSFGSSLSYKNFEFSFLLVYNLGHKMRNKFLPALNNSYSSAIYGYITDFAPVNKKINNRWKQAGDELKTNVPRVVYEYESNYSSDLYSMYSYSDINVINASNIRLNNIALSYKIPAQYCKIAHLSNARIQFNVENAYTWAANNDAKYQLGGYNSPNYVMGVYLNF
jgi:TonB-linked SusC/RagA family outer membrane protein